MLMDIQSQWADPIHIASLAELVQQTPLIIARINAIANGGRLFLADPIRLLSDIQVVLSPEAIRALEETLDLHNTDNPLRHLYDDFKQGAADTANPVIIKGIVPSTADHIAKHDIVPGAVNAGHV